MPAPESARSDVLDPQALRAKRATAARVAVEMIFMMGPNLGCRVGRRGKCRGRVMLRAAVMGVDRKERLYEAL
jgi:hypothetical protein